MSTLRFALRWEPSTHHLLEHVLFDTADAPAVVRHQAANLVCRLGEDSRWVAQPLAYAFSAPRAFDPASFAGLVAQPTESPETFSRQGWVDALAVLSERYPEITAILWDTVAVMGLRPEPHREEAIPNLGGILRHPWTVADAALHAAAKATALWSDLCNELAKHSGGYYAEHGCGCDHIVRELPKGATFPPMPADRRRHVTREFYEHFLAEIALIHVMGFPFSLHQNVQTYEGTLVPA
jgi:hypothetical protein